MADEKKLTGAELLKQQQEREAETRRAETLQREAENRSRAEAAQTALDAAIAKIGATWYDNAVSASKRDGTRFVVLAIALDGDQITEVAGLMNTIRAAGFFPDFVSSLTPTDSRWRATQNTKTGEETAVMMGSDRGWQPAGIPKLGISGQPKYLIVKWSD